MIKNITDLCGYRLSSLWSEEEIGQIQEFYIDDRAWFIHQAVLDTGEGVYGEKTRFDPALLVNWGNEKESDACVDEESSQVALGDTRQWNLNQWDRELAEDFNWPAYRQDRKSNFITEEPSGKFMIEHRAFSEDDNHLHSTNELFHYDAYAEDKKIGNIIDFLYDDTSWSIHYFVIKLNNTFNKKILISPAWIEWIEYRHASIHIGIKYRSILRAPEFNPSLPVTPRYEDRLYNYYGLTKY